MKKEEFPTYLNEQPVFIFGRTMRELLVLIIGSAFAYMVWTSLGRLIADGGVGIVFLKGIIALVPLVLSIAVAFVNIASRPLEEWALVGLFYCFTPKVFVYMPFDEAQEDQNEIPLQGYISEVKNEDVDID